MKTNVEAARILLAVARELSESRLPKTLLEAVSHELLTSRAASVRHEKNLPDHVLYSAVRNGKRYAFAVCASTGEVLGKNWSGDVDTKWESPEGFFTGSADSIAKGLKKNSKDLKQAMSRLTFYMNRAGKNLSSADKSRLESAKEKLQALYA